jgi:hypothetical protein
MHAVAHQACASVIIISSAMVMLLQDSRFMVCITDHKTVPVTYG